MAQLGARLNGIEEVVGSNPTGSTNYDPGLSPGFVDKKPGVIGYLLESRGHRVQALAQVFAEHSPEIAISMDDENQTRLLSFRLGRNRSRNHSSE